MNMNVLMQQAQKMQKEMEKAQKDLEAKVFTITSAGGGIVISITGAKEVKSIEIDDDMIDVNEKEMLQDMIVVAVNEAVSKVVEEEKNIMSQQTAGLKIPGMF